MRYIIGIDLGTTNSTVAYVDCAQEIPAIHNFRIPQLTAPGCIELRASLPSFCYIASEGEYPKGALDLPWGRPSHICVGLLAQREGARVPSRLVQSAKSWLCHAAANRRDRILPFEGEDERLKISPIKAAELYLQHIKEAWNFVMAKGHPDDAFEHQEIVLTVPASFDEVARALTAEAAKKAGLTHLTLVEEPQAAFYAWLAQNESSWQQLLPEGSSVLICDVGGGTTDFSLIEVESSETGPRLRRMSVGDHLLLGGDNIDAAIAHVIENELDIEELSLSEWSQLRQQARLAKEALLSEESKITEFTVVLQGKGASVIKGSRRLVLHKDKLSQVLLEGFFGQYEWPEALQLKKKSGMRTLGLPYEDEPSITKHVAHFLFQSHLSTEARGLALSSPDFVLFNGGTMKPTIFQEAILSSLKRWFPHKSPQLLTTEYFDAAVSRGAAYYGKVRRGLGVRISGGTARGFYLGLDIKDKDGNATFKALTLLPRGAEEGTTHKPHQTFWLKPNASVEFQVYTSHVRLYDAADDLIDINPEELHPLPPIRTQLLFGKRSAELQASIPVSLTIHLSPIGLLELSLTSDKTPHRWSLEFQMRTAAGQENSLSAIGDEQIGVIADRESLQRAQACVEGLFANGSPYKPSQVMDLLEKAFAAPRRDWSPNMLRSLWEPLHRLEKCRLRSHEWGARWWNLVGFCLRPGFGFPLDDFRCKDLWKIILADLRSQDGGDVEIQRCICFRRVAAGLNKGQQLQLAHELLPTVISKRGELLVPKRSSDMNGYTEKVRTLAALELIDISIKEKLAEALIKRIAAKEAIKAEYWALGRIGARHLFHGSISNVIPTTACSRWIGRLLDAQQVPSEELLFVIKQLARKTDCREINIAQNCITRILERLQGSEDFQELQKTLQEVSHMNTQEQERIFGEKLPAGLSLNV
jgi:hypothetical protein